MMNMKHTTTQCRSLHLVNIIVLLVGPSESDKYPILFCFVSEKDEFHRIYFL
jgi:hypothetical protein